MSTFSAVIDLTPAPRSVRVARSLVQVLLDAWGARHDPQDAALLTTEVVTNVVDHVGGDASFTLEVTLSDQWLRIAVVDGSAVQPLVRELDVAGARGRGMRMVAGIADRWGVEPERGGKRVWFELAPARS
ncbi:ATP-binding protein [Geodermatophilus sp. SYSU D00742]